MNIWGRLLSGVGWINLYEAADPYTNESPVYIIPQSSTALLTFDDIQYLSKEQLRLARNEIYARHGRKFEDEQVREYFESQWWYHGIIEPEAFTEEMLSETERVNASFIMTFE